MLTVRKRRCTLELMYLGGLTEVGVLEVNGLFFLMDLTQVSLTILMVFWCGLIGNLMNMIINLLLVRLYRVLHHQKRFSTYHNQISSQSFPNLDYHPVIRA